MHGNFNHKLMLSVSQRTIPGAYGITLFKQRSHVLLDVPTVGASIFWHFQVSPVNILRQAAYATVYGTG